MVMGSASRVTPSTVREALRFAEVRAAEIIPLRHQVLRPGRPIESAHFDGDDAPGTHHFAALSASTLSWCESDTPIAADAVLCCLTLITSALGGNPAWQLRGMATDPRAQRRGVGAALVAYVCAWSRDARPGWPLWCNARVSAQGFYTSAGWDVISETFDITGIGPHVKMVFGKMTMVDPPPPGASS